MPIELPESENTYFIDAEGAAEMARLMHQGRLLTKGMGGLFREQFNISNTHDILDIACGPGGWVLDVAHTYPKIQVTGIDISKLVIQYARAQAKVQWLNNAHFQTMDALKPLEFPDSSFDFVNTRFLFGFMSKEAWSQLMQECLGILRPGGTLRLTECESPLSNSLASERLYGMISQALRAAGRSFSPDGRNVGITPMIGRFLQDADSQNIHKKAHILDTKKSHKREDIPLPS
jgi:ubiquinone/menaquinone biosynthesis C-methylase UbiE